jgi:hypothetical protein
MKKLIIGVNNEKHGQLMLALCAAMSGYAKKKLTMAVA